MSPYIDQTSNLTFVGFGLDQVAQAESVAKCVPLSLLAAWNKTVSVVYGLTNTVKVIPRWFIRFPKGILPSPIGRHKMHEVKRRV